MAIRDIVQAAAGNTGEAIYVEDVFSTYLYTGNGASQTITTNVAIGDITAQANTSNTTASSIRAGSSLALFFTSGGVFANYTAGEYLLVDYGTPVTVTSANYENWAGSDWAPTSVLIQSSPDNSTWTTRATYSDNGTTSLQSISVTGGASARYWRLYQNSNTRAASAGYEWHLGRFRLDATDASVGQGGMIWIKSRSTAYAHRLFDTDRGPTNYLASESTNAQGTDSSSLTAFTTSGFSIYGTTTVNASSATYAAWSFRKAEKFFDVVTFTTNGSEPPNTGSISHNLGSTPGCVFVKSTSGSQDWKVYHRSLSTPANKYLELNSTGAVNDAGSAWISVSSTTISFPGSVLDPGVTYVAYLFAHDAGGFGDAGSDSIIKCGSFTTDGSGNATVDLGWEPQWYLRKQTSGTVDWVIFDNMRGWTNGGDDAFLYPNSSGAEASANRGHPTATGFTITNQSASSDFIYIAIRRGPMKTPTSGTSVFNTVFSAASGAPAFISGFPVDWGTWRYRSLTSNWNSATRLTGPEYLVFNSTAAGETYSSYDFDYQNGWAGAGEGSGTDLYSYCFRRAPGFFDVVCYTGTGGSGAININHNLGVAPQLMIMKSRSAIGNWLVYSETLGAGNRLLLNGTNASGSTTNFASTAPTASVFTVDAAGVYNSNSATYVAYLFATVTGVSKVGSYTGTGTTQQINCGFTNGARFVLIKRTDSTGNWYVWDSARGIVAGNDPYLLLNSSAAEVTNTDYVDTYSAGFEISSTAPAEINANGGSYIFLAIA